jgi:hypothetical protein
MGQAAIKWSSMTTYRPCCMGTPSTATAANGADLTQDALDKAVGRLLKSHKLLRVELKTFSKDGMWRPVLLTKIQELSPQPAVSMQGSCSKPLPLTCCLYAS